jgi:hypothetical protein
MEMRIFALSLAAAVLSFSQSGLAANSHSVPAPPAALNVQNHANYIPLVQHQPVPVLVDDAYEEVVGMSMMLEEILHELGQIAQGLQARGPEVQPTPDEQIYIQMLVGQYAVLSQQLEGAQRRLQAKNGDNID